MESETELSHDNPQLDPKLLEWSSYFLPYQVPLKEKWKDLLLVLNGSSWPVKSFLKSNVRARGTLLIQELFNDVILIAPEVISRSATTRGVFRIIIFDNIALIQDDEEQVSKNFFLEYLLPILDLSDEEIKEIRINAMRIRSLARKITPTSLTLLVNNQTAGVDGLEKITLSGQNVIRGIQTLKDRQEVDLKADSIGPWIDIETKTIRFTMGKGVLLVDGLTDDLIEVLKSTLE